MMNCPQRNVDPRRQGNNPQVNESEGRHLPGWTGANATRNRPPPCPVPSSSMKNQLRRSASNQVPARTTGNMLNNNTPVPFQSDSCTTGHTRVLPTNIPQRCAVKYDVSSQNHRSGQARTRLPNEDQRCATTLYGDSFPGGGKLGQRADDEVFARQSSEVEGARGFRTVGDHDRVLDVRNTTGPSQGRYFGETSSNNVKYINPKLVQKVLDSQRSRAQTPVGGQLQSNSNREVPSAGQRSRPRFMKPEHHLSDTSISNRLADCRVTDPETGSTGSQKESGYHSGDSVGDRLSENSEPGRNVQSSPTVVQPFPAISGSPDDVCEHYFLKGDSLVDLCSEQERSGNWQQAINFLNQAIDLFQQATNVSGVSHDNVLRMRLKHNRAILHRRKLVKQSGCSTETAPPRRLPCTPQDVKEISTDDVFSTNHQPISDHFNKVPIGLDCSDGSRGRGVGSGRGPRLCSSDGTGNMNFTEGRNSENVCVGACDPDLPEAGLQWTSDDVKDINIYATLPKKNRRGNGGPPVTNATTVNPLQTKLQSEIISVSCRNEESQRVSAAGNQTRNADGYRDYQHVTNDCVRNGMMQPREPAPVRSSRQVTSADVPRLHDSASHYFRSDDVNVRRMAQSTADQTKFVRF